MSNKPKREEFAPIGKLLQTLIHSSGLGLGDLDSLESLLNNAVNQYGVQLRHLQVVRRDVSEEQDKNPRYEYAIAFPDPHPASNQELITVEDFAERGWEAPSFIRYADAADGLVNRGQDTVVTHDPDEVFGKTHDEPRSESAKRVAAKKLEVELEERAALARRTQSARK